MDIQKINSDIATIEKGLNNPNITSDMKEKLRAKLAALKSQLETGAKQAEVVAEKAEDAADDEKKRLEKVINTIRKGLDNKQVPESAKPALRKKLQEAEAKMADIEKAAKEAATVAQEVKAEVKEAVAQVDDAIADVKKGKTVKKNAIGKVKGAAKKVVAEGKKRKTVATAHEKKYKDIIDELVALVKGNKKLSVVYKGASRDSLERDAARHALPPGRRVSKDGNIYFENRRNRVDVTKRKRYPFFDDGGVLQEIPNNYKGHTAEQVWNAWTDDQRDHFMRDHIDFFDNDKREDYISKRFSQLPEAVQMIIAGHTQDGQYAKGGKVKQGNPQGEHYTEDADAKRHAKPVGWRFTSKFLKSTAARSRGLKVTSKPTKADIDKYKDKQYPNGERYIYQETRADHSDKKKKDGL